jgi:GDPmannose 4,6-dehydratase
MVREAINCMVNMINSKKALITGVLGQDGSYLAELLYSKGYDVFGLIKKNTDPSRILWIKSLIPNIVLFAIDITNKKEVFNCIESVLPSEIYNFSSISDVFDPWENLDEIFDLNAKVPVNILDSIVKIDKSIRFFQASSCLVFGNDVGYCQNENTPTCPTYPYGAAKLFADNMIKEYRRHFDLFCCSGIFFSHESPRRGSSFFTKKVIKAAVDIKRGKQNKIQLGNLSVLKDYGYACDFIEAAYLMIQNQIPCDYVIGTGKLVSLGYFVESVFDSMDLNYRDFISIDCESNKRETSTLRADISKIKSELKWFPKHTIDDIISIMIKEEK